MIGIHNYYFLIIVCACPDAHKQIENLLSALSVLASNIAPIEGHGNLFSVNLKVKNEKHLETTKTYVQNRIPNVTYDFEEYKGHLSPKTIVILTNGFKFFIYIFLASLITGITTVVMTKFPNFAASDMFIAFVSALVVALGSIAFIFQTKAEKIKRLIE